MRRGFSEKVDKYVLSPALNNLIKEAVDYVLNLRETNDLDNILKSADITIPEFIVANNDVYVNGDSKAYHDGNDSTLFLVKYTPNLTEDQIVEYKKFLNDYYQYRICKCKWMVSNQLINIASIGSIGICGLSSYSSQYPTYNTIGYKLYRLADGLNNYYLNEKLCDVLEIDPLLDESVSDGNVTVKPITLDQVTNTINKMCMSLKEGSCYQQGDDDVCLDVEPWIDGIDTPFIVEVLLDLIKSNVVIGGNFNAKARENIELALNKANEYMQALPLTTKLTEIEIIGECIKKLLNVHDSIVVDQIGDSVSNTNIDRYKDINGELLADDIINFSKLAAKKFKKIYDNDTSDRSVYFPGPAELNTEVIKTKSGIDSRVFSVSYSEINKLGLTSYVAD